MSDWIVFIFICWVLLGLSSCDDPKALVALDCAAICPYGVKEFQPGRYGHCMCYPKFYQGGESK